MFNFWIFTIILVVVIVVFYAIFMSRSLSVCSDELVGSIIGIVLILYILLVLFMFVGYNFTENSNVIKIYETVENVVSLRDEISINSNGEVSGGLFFTYGAYNSESGLDYYVMVGSDEEGYLIKKLSSECVYLFLDGTDSPRYVSRYETLETFKRENFLFGGFFKVRNIPKQEDILVKQELHVPENAIQIQWSIDMQ